MIEKQMMVLLPSGEVVSPPEGYEYRGDDGGNEHLPNDSGHYWMSGYAIWRPPVGSKVLNYREAKLRAK